MIQLLYMTTKKSVLQDTDLYRGGALLYQLQRQISVTGKDEIKCCGVTLAQGMALLAFDTQQSMLMGELSALVNTQKSTCTRLVDILVRDGLLQRVADDTDRRSVRISLTSQGVRLRDQLNECYHHFWEKLFSHIPEDNKKSVINVLTILTETLSHFERISCACSNVTKEHKNV